MSSTRLLTRGELGRLREAASAGFENAASGLSMMVNREIRVTSPDLRIIPIEQVPGLIGELDETVVAIYLSMIGDASGHILLVLSMDAASELVEMLLGERLPAEMEMGEMMRSALAEVANITSSFFLSSVADLTGLTLQPSPPAVIVDMAGAALDVPLLAVALDMEKVLVIDTWFVDDDHQINGLFLMFPDIPSLRLIVERMSHGH